jgi:hypothetical protein
MLKILLQPTAGFAILGQQQYPSALVRYWASVRAEVFNVAFCSYLHLQYFNWAAVPGGRISNPPTSQSPIVACNKSETL